MKRAKRNRWVWIAGLLWYMRYYKKKRPPGCHFNPCSDYLHVPRWKM
jgi:hypothetical protein